MAIQSKVGWKYRTPYIPGKEIPDSELKQMKSEITEMRKNLLKKQKRLEQSKEFSSDERLKNELQSLKVNELNTKSKIWNTWNRLESLEESNKTSIAGKRETRKRQIESLNQRGYDFINNKNFDQFGEFMDFVNENYSLKAIGSDTVADYFYEHSGESENELQEGFEQYIQSH